MREWINAMFIVGDKVVEAVEAIDKHIDRISLNIVGDTMQICQEIMYFSDKKRRLVNFIAMSRLLKENLNKGDLLLIQYRLMGYSFDFMANKFCVSNSTIVRKFNRAMMHACVFLRRQGVSEKSLESEYYDIPFIVNITVHKKTKSAYKNNSSYNGGANACEGHFYGITRA